MKLSKTPSFRAGIFVVISFILLVSALFTIGDKEKLFSSTYKYYVKIKEITGLKVGAQVQMSGINVGSVSSIQLPKKAGDSVVIAINIIKDAVNLVRMNSRAQIITEGLVGNKAILITTGSLSEPSIQPHDTLIGTTPFDLTSVVSDASNVLTETLKSVKETSELIREIRTGNGTIPKLLTDPSLYESLVRTNESISSTLHSLNMSGTKSLTNVASLSDSLKNTTSEINEIIRSIKNGKGSVGKLLTNDDLYNDLLMLTSNLKSITAQLQDISIKLSRTAGNGEEITEALKHNILVKGYFEDRGYWNSYREVQNTLSRQIDSLKRILKQ
jgi:phospholipid/cholesterol/gamma-HCH transport system substrate-binding protein